VDEYQDVNPLQAGLLERWLDDRDELCVVGDDYQTIYAFTGASPEHLLGFTTRFPHATVVRAPASHAAGQQRFCAGTARVLAPARWDVLSHRNVTHPRCHDAIRFARVPIVMNRRLRLTVTASGRTSAEVPSPLG